MTAVVDEVQTTLEEHSEAARLELGRMLRVEGMRRAEEAADGWDIAVIDQAIEAFAKLGDEFSANDLRELLPPVRGPLMGARFTAAARRGVIRRIGYTPSTDPGTHAHPIALWRGVA